MADEGLHEIQLNGKQLVFLFMASTVVAVVIFLCGVMVGRGVPSPRVNEPAETAIEGAVDPTAIAPATPSIKATTIPPSTTQPAPDDLKYPEELGGPEPQPDPLKGPVESAPSTTKISAPAPPTSVLPSTPVKALTPAAPRSSSSAPSSLTVKPAPVNLVPEKPAGESVSTGEPVGNGFAVQVAAVNDRRDAETIAHRLAGKGYPSFVSTPGKGTPHMFRVRVGKYKNRREAELIASRLQKEEQFKPWVTR